MSSHLQLLAAGSHAVDGDDVGLPLLADWEQKRCSACQQTNAGQHQDCRSIVSRLVLHLSQSALSLGAGTAQASIARAFPQVVAKVCHVKMILHWTGTQTPMYAWTHICMEGKELHCW